MSLARTLLFLLIAGNIPFGDVRSTYRGISTGLTTGSQAISSRGLIAAYDMASETASGALRDFGPNGLHGTAETTRNFTAIFGGAREFRTVSERIDLPENSAFDASGPLSVALWLRADRLGLHQHVFVCDDKFALWITPENRIRFSDTQRSGIQTRESIQTNSWYSVVVTLEGAPGEELNERTLRLYLNGRNVDGEIFGTTEPPSWNPGPLHDDDACYFGFESHQGMESHETLHFEGAIDEALLFGRALSAEEARAHAAIDPDLTKDAASIPVSRYTERRKALMDSLPDGITLLHARSEEKAMEQPGWAQDPSFLYFTGLHDQAQAILALDATRSEAHLFVPPAPVSFGIPITELELRPSAATTLRLGLDSVRPWDEFSPWISSRLADGNVRLYVDAPRRSGPSGVPEGMRPIAGTKELWKTSVEESFPDADIATAVPGIGPLRWRKDEYEIRILRRNARITTNALIAGASVIRPGAAQRAAEAVVVAECIGAGGQGPSFWPWLMSGPNTSMGRLVRSFFDYEHLNRTMLAGELVRVDIGCTSGSYGGDVGRTIPVSGFFDETQSRVWDLLIAGYLGGVEAMKANTSVTEVLMAARRALLSYAADRDDAILGEIADAMVSEIGGVNWHVHGVGIESGEEKQEILADGTVLAFEPMYSLGADTYYLEDMILVTADGYEILSSGLPYFSEEIESFMTSLSRTTNR